VKFLTFEELKAVKGIPYTRRHIRNLTITGEFPEPVTLGESRICWVESEIDEWMAKKESARARRPPRPTWADAPPAPPAASVAPASAQPRGEAPERAVPQGRATSKQPVVSRGRRR
jgi:predicted DNA-binding transcriptional regulator AlpA